MGPEPPFGQLQASKVAANRPLSLETSSAGHAQNDGRFCRVADNLGSRLANFLLFALSSAHKYVMPIYGTIQLS